MKKMKFLLLMFIFIGFATISVSLSTRGNTYIASDLDDFKVYFSDVIVNGQQDLSIVDDKHTIVFNYDFGDVGSTQVINYEITNGSKYLDASLSINCVGGNDYFSVTNEFDTSNLVALSSRNGVLTLKKIKSLAQQEGIEQKVTCTIVANPIEKTEDSGVGNKAPVLRKFEIGDEITIGTEKFNVISQTDDSITMLAKYNISSDNFLQTEDIMWDTFSFYQAVSKGQNSDDVDLTQWVDPASYVLEEYKLRLIKELGGQVSTDYVSLNDLRNLDCTIYDSYSWSNPSTCVNSEYSSWLINGQKWWTKTMGGWGMYFVETSGVLGNGQYYDNGGSLFEVAGFRPTVTVSKEILANYL